MASAPLSTQVNYWVLPNLSRWYSAARPGHRPARASSCLPRPCDFLRYDRNSTQDRTRCLLQRE
ncbi:hypothetical protein FRAHR75_360062 [Frankia sp. Hr75.2]|nr:hypothetical protein FRAHR75_360062 [Frankia sp. Hr75.2]